MVARTRNLTRAAKELHTTPPSVSSHIRTLENELNLSLFIRTAKGMQITPQGEALKAKAGEILNAADQFVHTARSFDSTPSGRIRFGINADPGILRLPRIIRTIHDTHPDIRVDIIPSSTGEILDALSRGDMDCGFVFGPNNRPDLKTDHLSGLGLTVAVPIRYHASHSFASLEQLARLPWITPDNYCPFFHQVKSCMDQNGITLSRILYANDDITKMAFVEQGLGVCVLLGQEAQPFMEKGVVFLWKGEHQFTSEISFAHLKRRKTDPVLKAFRRCVQAVWSEPDPDAPSFSSRAMKSDSDRGGE